MKPAAFAYHGPRSLDEALSALAEVGPDGKVLAGGQSLVPMLNMRLATPGHLVDINRIGELDSLRVDAAGVRVGALARHARVEASAEVAAAQPLLGQALRHVAHPVIRNRGTVVGSIAHADPAAEIPVVLAVLGGTVEVASVEGRREVAAEDFFAGPLEPALEPGELAVSAFFPRLPARAATAFAEVSRRHGDYAMAGVAALVTAADDGRVAGVRAGYLSVAPTPLVLDLTPDADAHRGAGGDPDWAAVAGLASERVEPEPDIHASADYRRRLVRVLTERVLREAAARCGAAGAGPESRRER